MSRTAARRWGVRIAALAVLLLGAFGLGYVAGDRHMTHAVVPPWPPPLPEFVRSPTPTSRPTDEPDAPSPTPTKVTVYSFLVEAGRRGRPPCLPWFGDISASEAGRHGGLPLQENEECDS